MKYTDSIVIIYSKKNIYFYMRLLDVYLSLLDILEELSKQRLGINVTELLSSVMILLSSLLA